MMSSRPQRNGGWGGRHEEIYVCAVVVKHTHRRGTSHDVYVCVCVMDREWLWWFVCTHLHTDDIATAQHTTTVRREAHGEGETPHTQHQAACDKTRPPHTRTAALDCSRGAEEQRNRRRPLSGWWFGCALGRAAVLLFCLEAGGGGGDDDVTFTFLRCAVCADSSCDGRSRGVAWRLPWLIVVVVVCRLRLATRLMSPSPSSPPLPQHSFATSYSTLNLNLEVDDDDRFVSVPLLYCCLPST